MRRLHPFSILLLLPFLALGAVVPGCGKGGDADKPKGGNVQNPKGGSGGGDEDKEPAELASTGWGTLKGTVVYDGEAPKPAKLEFGDKHGPSCTAGAKDFELVEQTWMVDPKTKGVENAVVFLKAPEGMFFKIKDEDRSRKGEVILDQPHCVFVPHTFTLYPSFYDAKTKKRTPTGQVLEVKNSATFLHDTKFASENNGGGTLVQAGTTQKYTLKPDPEPVSFKCNVHPWMNAKAWVFDHPYAAVTDKEGKFEIRNVPTGVELYVVGWHEGVAKGGYFADTGRDGKKMKLETNNEVSFKIKAK